MSTYNQKRLNPIKGIMEQRHIHCDVVDTKKGYYKIVLKEPDMYNNPVGQEKWVKIHNALIFRK